MLLLEEYQRMLGENRRASNVRISVFVHSLYLSLCTKYILGASKFAESTNTGEYCSENQFRDFSSIYARMSENVDEYSVFAYSRRIDVCVVLALK